MHKEMTLFIGALLAAFIMVVAQEVPQVAFTAKLEAEKINADENMDITIVFGKTTANVGNFYDTATGEFTSKNIKSTYVFSFTLMSLDTGKPVFGCLMRKQYDQVNKIYGEPEGQVCVWSVAGKSNEMSSNMAVLELEKMDKVYVVLKKGNRARGLHNRPHEGYCSFTGFMLPKKEE